MSDPIKTTDSEQTSDPDIVQTEGESVDQSPINPKKRIIRSWLLFGLLALLVILLVVRDDVRQNAAESSENALHYIAFDVLGWSPRDLFIWRLRMAGLLDSPLGQRWIEAVNRAGEQPVQAGGQFRTTESFTSDEVEAHVYQVSLERGEKLIWQFSRLDNAESRLYASLERREKNDQQWSTITELDADDTTNSQVVSKAGAYRIVLQPELFANAEYSLAMANGGSLPFPVEGAGQRDIGSAFGVERDGGARKHHGVDIFAERGTPVTAVIDGYVRTGTGARGGEHVWLSGSMIGFGSARYYYAHLDSFAVESGDRVKRGDILGYVGNTGNAITTPPHLHFGIYSGGPVDPAPFLKPEPELPAL
ncbi:MULTISPECIES: M23 family metallopeptidase [unclassified Methylophaga]|jgi:murein DD-endopeptidase MepM/ murein hydrolase activator NlpD|uniref:M23 family metallopeptidase n=1 Tax=unclassified Methylophaga TaxID=2629249 RepID=UPI000C8FDE1F|nr:MULTISPECIES: M23 family metallopeptidase [unclassified Methylophaga]MAP26089.1 peptidase M23 [Methylophaga sp.]HBX59367.1 M23 family peptidase [Methylophaga sp.]HCO01503.1 M23 family peptidase [Methylophaga sp.]|tara:strand:+ start:919 stop:2007 length:1089 start_codon:yes stop_codon:yes gene_type:complete